MKVIVKEPGKRMEVVDVDAKYRCDVSSLIEEGITREYVHIKPNELDMMVDEDGLMKQLPLNFFLDFDSVAFPIQAIVGTVVFCRYKWENPWEKEIYDFELQDVTEADIETVRKLLDTELQFSLQMRFR